MNPAAEYFAIKSEPVTDKLKALGISVDVVIKGGGWKPKLSRVERVGLSEQREKSSGSTIPTSIGGLSWCLKEDGEPAFIMPVCSQSYIIDHVASRPRLSFLLSKSYFWTEKISFILVLLITENIRILSIQGARYMT